MRDQLIAVFGGTGFLGRQIVRALAESGQRVRVLARHPEAVPFRGIEDRLERQPVDVGDERSIMAALTGATAAVNAISLYRESGNLTFDAIHVRAAGRLARCARDSSLARLVHISGIGVDQNSPSAYVRARALGEAEVCEAFPAATILRPSVMFGRDDAFLQAARKAVHMPVVPLFGRGETLLQPVYVGDVAAAATRALAEPGFGKKVYELGGGAVYRYREILEAVMEVEGLHRPMVPVPFGLWRLATRFLSVLPEPPLTRDQVLMLEADNVEAPGSRGFPDFGIRPASLDAMLSWCLKPRRQGRGGSVTARNHY